MEKFVFFAFNGESMCFLHVLLNALELDERGFEVRVVIEGSATKLIPEFSMNGGPVSSLYRKAAGRGLIEGACRACSGKMGTLEAAKGEGLRLLDDMSGHPSMPGYIEQGYSVVTF